MSPLRKRRKYRHDYMIPPIESVNDGGLNVRTDPAADGRSASSGYDQPEPWHSNPEVQMNELARPTRYKSHLHRSVFSNYSLFDHFTAVSRQLFEHDTLAGILLRIFALF